ncbi:MAG: HIT family protein [Nanoarchaeota archaeon]|nr:HIT family protein [Nanoarchaeota archaeon]MBU1445575.1 HIT family protein [Nanoarchaeota archaeon]MBU2406893.1 HIT family protein [Nanoarchaeota archaeon]MBU2420744.1 HIT family protein [Nanoarchaeota archaeon]MBU2475464.1 HIT family protein [Nanoarchaeota archaeon]
MNECIFCKIIKGEIPAKIIYEDKDVISFLDRNQVNKGHALVMPKKHHKNFLVTPRKEFSDLMEVSKKVAEAQMKILGSKGFNLIVNTNKAAGQVVDHLHIHVIPRYREDGLQVTYGGDNKKGASDEEYEKIKSFLKH